MSLLWTDGFDRYTNAADYALNYSGSVTTHSAAGGAQGTGAALFDSNVQLTKTFQTAGVLSSGNAVHAAFYVRPEGFSQAQDFFLITTNVGSAILTANATDGSISVKRHTDGTVLATSAAGTLQANVRVHLEYAAKFETGANGGYIKVWVGGNLVIDFAGTTISGSVPTSYVNVRIGRTLTSAGQSWEFDDLICWDENGTDFALTQLTATYLPLIETLDIDADDSVQFTPSAGSNFQNVDETGFHDGDTTYNSSATVGHVDQFTVENPATTPAYVFAVVQKTVAKIDVAGSVTMRTRMISGGTTQESGNYVMTTSYSLKFDPFGKDPDTSAVWDVSAPASIKIGYEFQA